MKNNEKPLNNIFIKFLDFKLSPTSKKIYKSLLIYRNVLIENHAIHVQVKMGVRKFLSAHMKSEKFGEFYEDSLENFFHEECLKIFEEEKKLVKHVYSIHILHMRTIQWKLIQSAPKLNAIPVNLYLENFKKSIKSQDSYVKYIPSPSSGYNNFTFDILKKVLMIILKQDYQNFQRDEKEDSKKEDFLNFSLVLEKAYIFDNLQIHFPGFLENCEDEIPVFKLKLINFL